MLNSSCFGRLRRIDGIPSLTAGEDPPLDIAVMPRGSVEVEVALIGKMSRGRRGEPFCERTSSRWRQAVFGYLRAASEKFGQFT